MSVIQQVSSNSFDAQVLQADVPVLVDFYADWCGPCQAQTPILESLAQAEGNELNIVKVDVDQDPSLAQRYGVRSIPTLVLFHNGAANAVRTGVSTQTQLKEMIDQPG